MTPFYKTPAISEILFGSSTKLLPSLTEYFEFELANLEYNMLTKQELTERGAFFEKVDGEFTNHFLLYSSYEDRLHINGSKRTQEYFKSGQFSTGYATHGLFPYRGKFHPQLIKAILNIIGIKEGETILDPMMGSGTTNLEASLIGINSYGIDKSPFCQLMSKTKHQILTTNKEFIRKFKYSTNELFNFHYNKNSLKDINDKNLLNIYFLSLLAYLDSLGYSKRVKNGNHKTLFKKVLTRYIDTVIGFLENRYFNANLLGNFQILRNSDALNIELKDNSIDGIITSPPYSFAINYIENDRDQLAYLNVNISQLENNMIGLKGKNKKEKLEYYFKDMKSFLQESSRVLKSDKYLVIIIGSNTNQTRGIRLEEKIINFANNYNLKLVKTILKPIKGMRNTLKDEYILFFRKN